MRKCHPAIAFRDHYRTNSTVFEIIAQHSTAQHNTGMLELQVDTGKKKFFRNNIGYLRKVALDGPKKEKYQPCDDTGRLEQSLWFEVRE